MLLQSPEIFVSEISGSIKDVTFSRNHYGPYSKQKLTQPASNTPGQIIRRNAVTAAVAAWKTISENDFLAWSTYVTQHKRSLNISRKIKIAAYNEFVSRYLNRSLLASSVTGFKPLPFVRMFPYIEDFTLSTNSILLSYKSLIFASDCDFMLYATPPLSSNINFPNLSLYKAIGSFTPGSGTGTFNMFSLYTTAFTLTPADINKKIFVGIKAINSDNFAASAKAYNHFTVTASIVPNFFKIQLFNDDYYQSEIKSFVKSTFIEPNAPNKTRAKLWLFYRY